MFDGNDYRDKTPRDAWKLIQERANPESLEIAINSIMEGYEAGMTIALLDSQVIQGFVDDFREGGEFNEDTLTAAIREIGVSEEDESEAYDRAVDDAMVDMIRVTMGRPEIPIQVVNLIMRAKVVRRGFVDMTQLIAKAQGQPAIAYTDTVWGDDRLWDTLQ